MGLTSGPVGETASGPVGDTLGVTGATGLTPVGIGAGLGSEVPLLEQLGPVIAMPKMLGKSSAPRALEPAENESRNDEPRRLGRRFSRVVTERRSFWFTRRAVVGSTLQDAYCPRVGSK